jgi:SAM-dependent methyltransferase
VGFAAGDAVRLPFVTGAFDSTYCVAVLQHVPDVAGAIAEFARVTRPNGRVVAVEPDNAARYAYSSTPSGTRVFDAVAQLFAAVTAARGEATGGAVGPKLAELFSRNGIEPVDVRLFPVSNVIIGPAPPELWKIRREAIQRTAADGSGAAVRALSASCLDLLAAYEAEARDAGASFVEIQNTTLFATVGQTIES